jgi:class 3 adenylate cyclase
VANEELEQRLAEIGVPAEALEQARERGDPSGAIFDAVLLPARAERTVSLAEVEAAGGLTVEEAHEFIKATGLPPPDRDEPAFTPEEADVLIRLPALKEAWPKELYLQVMRVQGRLLGRIAQTEIQVFRTYAEPRLRARSKDPLSGLRAVQFAFSQLLPMADPLLVGIHRRWVEHELGQVAVRDAEALSEGALPGAVDATFLFCDLKDFTAYADIAGDAAAVAVIDRFTDVVINARGPDCRLTKLLGDGYMLVFGDPLEAVRAATEVVDGMASTDVPGVHASSHRGVALAREGDYFGSAVNLAARLLAVAGRDELVGTDALVESTRGHFQWEEVDTVEVRGVTEPVRVHRLVADG